MKTIKNLLLVLSPPIIIVVFVLCMIFGPIELFLTILAVFATITITIMLLKWLEFITDKLIDVKLDKNNHLEQIIDVEIRMLNGVHSLEEGKPFWKGTYNELRWFARYFYKLGLEEGE